MIVFQTLNSFRLVFAELAVINPILLFYRPPKALQSHLTRVLGHDTLDDAGADAQRSADLEDAVPFGA